MALGKKQDACLNCVSLSSTWEPEEDLHWAVKDTGGLTVERHGGVGGERRHVTGGLLRGVVVYLQEGHIPSS